MLQWLQTNVISSSLCIHSLSISIADLAVVGNVKTDIKLLVSDKKVVTSNIVSRYNVGTMMLSLLYNKIKVENLKLLPADYEVTISKPD